jgi:hypothetical protein
MNIIWSADRVIRGIDVTNDFTVSTTYNYTQHGGTTGPVTDKDVSATQATGTTTDIGFSVSVTNPLGTGYSITNNSPAVASLSGTTFTPLANGTVNYTVTVPGNGTRAYSGTSALGGSPMTTYEVSGYTSGSLARHVKDAIVARLATTLPSITSRTPWLRYSGGTEYIDSVASPSNTKNASCWASNWDFSGISYNRHVLSGGVQQERWTLPVTLIHTGSDTTTRFGLVANHTPILPGYKVNWMKQDGSFVQGTVQSVVNIGGDLDLVYFTSNIVGPLPLKTLGSGWEAKLPCAGGGLSNAGGNANSTCLFVGGLMWDNSGYSHVRVGKLGGLNSSGAGMNTTFNAVNDPYLYTLFGSYSWPIWIGDSSGPGVLPINGVPTLITTQHTIGGGPSIPYYRTAIDAAMTTLAGASTTFSTVDLSGFTTF